MTMISRHLLVLMPLIAMGSVLGGEESPAKLDAKVFWDLSEQRTGRVNVVSIRLETETDPGVPVAVELALPKGVRFAADSAAKQPVTAWTRGTVIANSVQTYFQFEKKPEKRLGATLSWRVEADAPVDAVAQATLSGATPSSIPVRFDFRAPPQGIEPGKIPPPVPAKHDYHIGALYYPGWVPGEGSGWSLLDPYPERKPALGYHDGRTVDTANWEIKWAAENGIDFFFYCWYLLPGKDPSVENLFLGQALHDGFMKSPFQDAMHFAILWENAEGRADSSPTFFREKLVPFWIAQYFKHPRQLRVDGKPVFGIYAVDAFVKAHGSVENAAESIRFLREEVAKAGLPGIWILGEHRYAVKETLQMMTQLGLDASFAYCFGFPEPMTNAAAREAIIKMHDTQVAQVPLPVVPTVSASWDPQPWAEYIDYIWHKVPFWLDPPEFKQLVQSMKDRLDRRDEANPLARRMLLIDNWNEYAEGHWVAPSRKEGFRYLNAIRDVFAPDAAKRPNIMLEDVGLAPDESAYQEWKKHMILER